jgi:branched-chain amino acid transport system permease protein
LFEQQLVNGFTLGLIYALIAVGYTMVYGVIELINFAHGEIYMLGAFLTLSLISLGLPLPLAVLGAMLATAGLGVLLDIIAYRPLRQAPRLAALITAIGMSIFLQNLAMIIWGSRPLPFPKHALPAFFDSPALTFADVTITWMQMSIYVVALGLMVALNLIITKTRVGTAMRALAQNQTAAALMGINVNRVISFTFALGSGMGAVAGIMVSMYYNTMSPTMGYLAGVKAFAAAVLGGIGSVPGAMLGGVVLGIAETLGAGYISSPYRDGVAYAVMILVIIFRPSGLLGRAVVEKA